MYWEVLGVIATSCSLMSRSHGVSQMSSRQVAEPMENASRQSFLCSQHYYHAIYELRQTSAGDIVLLTVLSTVQ